MEIVLCVTEDSFGMDFKAYGPFDTLEDARRYVERVDGCGGKHFIRLLTDCDWYDEPDARRVVIPEELLGFLP